MTKTVIKEIAVTAAGGTTNIDLDTVPSGLTAGTAYMTGNVNRYRMTGGGGSNLASGLVIRLNPAITPIKGMSLYIENRSNLVYTGAGIVTIIGYGLSAMEAACDITVNPVCFDYDCYYNGTKWVVKQLTVEEVT